MRIQPASGLPIYRQIMEQVEHALASGETSPGDPLPSVRELSRQLGVNPTTITKAYGELEHRGIVETRRGKGTFFAELPAASKLDRAARRAALTIQAERLAVQTVQLGLDLKDAEVALADAFEELVEARKTSASTAGRGAAAVKELER